jgi:cytochrome c peroxidase
MVQQILLRWVALFALTTSCISEVLAGEALTPLQNLGQSLYFDTNFSLTRTQSCATCHNPSFAFSDPRENAFRKAASIGDDNKSVGDRNSPSIAYTAIQPPLHKLEPSLYRGGFFWDGRAKSLEEQAGGPPFNTSEMGLKNPEMLLERIKENSAYVEQFTALFEANSLENGANALNAWTTAVAAFERTSIFARFSSKYDRYLEGNYKPTRQEELGMTLFFSQQFTNCASCHMLNNRPASKQEPFSSYEYHNIGIPSNPELRTGNGLGKNYQDEGLFYNALIDDVSQKGRFKTPSLRNVAVTAPYMHNGVFEDLSTVLDYYNKFNSRKKSAKINPETGQPWRKPEVAENMSIKRLEQGPALNKQRLNALEAFLKMLTDERYEHLL